MHVTVKILLLFLLFPINAWSEVAQWSIVPDKSTLSFTATQNSAPISGTLGSYGGDIYFDPKQLESSHVHIVIDMASVAGSYKELINTLKMSEWFDVKKFPQAVFTADKFTKLGDHTYQANGTLTIRDKSNPVHIQFEIQNASTTQLQVKGETHIERLDFGIGQGEWSDVHELKNEIRIHFNVTLQALT